MPDYQKSKIYVIRSAQTDQVYVGSTTQRLSKRFYDHKNKANLCTSKLMLEFDDAYIELIEKYPCNDGEELRRREGEWIRKLNSVNIVIPCRTRKEYREDNKVALSIKFKQWYDKNKYARAVKKRQYAKMYRAANKEKCAARDKVYYNKNKEKIDARLNLKFECPCGGQYTNRNKSRHFKTKTHRIFLFNQHNIFNHL